MKNYIDTYTNKDIKNIFEKYDAFDKAHTIDRNTLFRELDDLKDGKKFLNKLMLHQVVRKYNNRYYFCKETEENKSVRTRAILLKLVPYFCLIIVVIIAIIFAYNKSSFNKKTNVNQNSISNTIVQDDQISTYDIEDFDMQIVVPSTMKLATGSELDYMLGQGASSFYKLALYNNTSSITCFIQDTNLDTVNKYWNSISSSYSSDSNYTIISDQKEENISGFTFTTFEAESKEYKELFIGIYKNNKFISFQYTYPSTNNDSRKVLNEIIKKLN